jgi:hypothetical protein
MQFLRTRPDVVGSSECRRDARHVGDTHLSASETSTQVPTQPLRYVPKGVSVAVRQLIDGMVFLRVCEFHFGNGQFGVANDSDDSGWWQV